LFIFATSSVNKDEYVAFLNLIDQIAEESDN